MGDGAAASDSDAGGGGAVVKLHLGVGFSGFVRLYWGSGFSRLRLCLVQGGVAGFGFRIHVRI